MTTLNHKINENIFRKNDIRGKVPEDLNFKTVKIIGNCFAQYILDKVQKKPYEVYISIGYDARLHSIELANGLIEGITETGINVINLGRCPTPLVYFSSFYSTNEYPLPDASVMITGSHNPPDYNGLKMCLGTDCLKSNNIVDLKDLFIANNKIICQQKGKIINFDLKSKYIDKLSKEFTKSIKRSIKIVVDSGNGCGGEIAPPILKNMDCEVIELYSEADGNFPNHHPDPTVIDNLKDLINTVITQKADLGVAYDGDVDRIGVIDNKGNIIPGDMLMLMFAMDIIESEKYNNPTFISEVKCSQVLYDTLNSKKANAIMWKTGHSFIKDKMKETKALLAGEMSGHIFFADRYYGFDDAIYATARLVEFISKNKEINPTFSISEYLSRFPKMYATPEIRKKCPDNIKFEVINKLKDLLTEIQLTNKDIKDIITIDGIRVVFNDGFGLVRASNTEPILVLRFEASTTENMLKNQKFIENLLEKVLP